MIAAFTTLWREVSVRYYEWALTHIRPDHEDVPLIIRRINTLKCRRLDRA